MIDLGEADQLTPGSQAIIYSDNPVAGAPRILLGELAILTTGSHWGHRQDHPFSVADSRRRPGRAQVSPGSVEEPAAALRELGDLSAPVADSLLDRGLQLEERSTCSRRGTSARPLSGTAVTCRRPLPPWASTATPCGGKLQKTGSGRRRNA